MRRRISLLALGLSACMAWLGASDASATVMVEVPLEQLVQRADAIVHGTVTRTGTRLEMRESGLEPQTLVTLRVHSWIAGEGGETVTLRELGGTWQGGGLRFEGTPQYTVGEEVVVYVHQSLRHPTRIYQGEQRYIHRPTACRQLPGSEPLKTRVRTWLQEMSLPPVGVSGCASTRRATCRFGSGSWPACV